MMENDTRETIPASGSFYEQVKGLFEKKQKIAALYDDNGLTRANGLITALFEKEDGQWMKLDDGTEIRIDKLQAVNGVFSSDFSTC